jgi:hypothetical protein
MPYQFATESRDYSDLAAGRILQNFPGHPAFPIRLASEIFQRCLPILAKENIPVSVYDPCCGGAYLLTTLAYEHWSQIHTIIGSDIDTDALNLAERNLSLLTLDGLDQRLATRVPHGDQSAEAWRPVYRRHAARSVPATRRQ